MESHRGRIRVTYSFVFLAFTPTQKYEPIPHAVSRRIQAMIVGGLLDVMHSSDATFIGWVDHTAAVGMYSNNKRLANIGS